MWPSSSSETFLFKFIPIFLTLQLISGKKCPGFCTEWSKCKKSGGQMLGYCTNQLACCNLSTVGSCGEHKGNDSTALEFQSPDFPQFHSKDLICEFSFDLRDDTVGVLLDFKEFSMDDIKFGPTGYNCDVDLFFIRGFDSWSPPSLCGNLRNYKFVIDQGKTEGLHKMTLLAVMSSAKYRWHIKISQIPRSQLHEHQNWQTKNSGKSEDTVKFTRDAYEKLSIPRPSSPLSPLGQTLEMNDVTFDQTPKESPLVVNGDDGFNGKVPWQASLRYDKLKIFVNITKEETNCHKSEGLHFCGGSIISDREILSAAHCFGAMRKSLHLDIFLYKVVLGDINNCRDDEGVVPFLSETETIKNENVQEFGIESVTLHFAYDKETVFNDVAIIRLNRTINFTQNVHPIKMANKGDNFTLFDAFLSGWGVMNFSTDSMPKMLQWSDNLKINPTQVCIPHTVESMHDRKAHILTHPKYRDIFQTTLCTSTKNESRDILAAPGDSGGPLVVKYGTSTPVLVGIVSYGYHLSRSEIEGSVGDFLDYYQSVSYYRHWIDLALCSLNSKSKEIVHETKGHESNSHLVVESRRQSAILVPI